MKKSTLALAVAVGVLAQHAYADGQADAKGFIEGATSTLGLRNFYINTDNREARKACSELGLGMGSGLRSALHLRLHPRHRRFRP